MKKCLIVAFIVLACSMIYSQSISGHSVEFSTSTKLSTPSITCSIDLSDPTSSKLKDCKLAEGVTLTQAMQAMLDDRIKVGKEESARYDKLYNTCLQSLNDIDNALNGKLKK